MLVSKNPPSVPTPWDTLWERKEIFGPLRKPCPPLAASSSAQCGAWQELIFLWTWKKAVKTARQKNKFEFRAEMTKCSD